MIYTATMWLDLSVKDYLVFLLLQGLRVYPLTSLLSNQKFSNLDKSFSTAKELWNSMGLFLQKTNIIRDYKEDVEAVHPRIFYPEAIWYFLFVIFEYLHPLI